MNDNNISLSQKQQKIEFIKEENNFLVKQIEKSKFIFINPLIYTLIASYQCNI